MSDAIRRAIGSAELAWYGKAEEADIPGFSMTGDTHVAITDGPWIIVEDSGGIVRGIRELFGKSDGSPLLAQALVFDRIDARVPTATIHLKEGKVALQLDPELVAGLGALMFGEPDTPRRTHCLVPVFTRVTDDDGEGSWTELHRGESEWTASDEGSLALAYLAIDEDNHLQIDLGVRDDKTQEWSSVSKPTLDPTATLPKVESVGAVSKLVDADLMQVILLDHPLEIDGTTVDGVAIPIIESAFANACESAWSERLSIPAGSRIELDATITGRAEGDESIEEEAGRVTVHDAGVAITLKDGRSWLIASDDIARAYATDDELYLLSAQVGFRATFESVSATSTIAVHPVLESHVGHQARSPAMLAFVEVEDEPMGLAEVLVEGPTLGIHHAGRDSEALVLAEIERIEVDRGQLDLVTKDSHYVMRAGEWEVRDLVDCMWRTSSELKPRLLPADYRHRDERLHHEEARKLIDLLPVDRIREHHETEVEPAEVPDLIGKAVRVGPRQFAAVAARVDEIAALLDIDPPPAYVLDRWQCAVDAKGLSVPRLEIGTRCLAELTEGELDFLLARSCAHIALGHNETEIYGQQTLRLLQSGGQVAESGVTGTGGLIGRLVGGGLGIIAGPAGMPIGAGVGKLIGRQLAVRGASSAKVFDAEGELMVARTTIYRWFRTATLSADALGLLFCANVDTAVRALLMTVFNSRAVVDEIDLSLYLAQIEAIESVEGEAAIYSRFDESLPYGPHRIATLMGYAASRRGISAQARADRMKTEISKQS